MTAVVASLRRFGDALEAEGFGVRLRQPADSRPVLNVWNPAAPGVGVSVVIEVPDGHYDPWREMPLAVRALTAVFSEWGIPLPVAAR